MLLRAMHALAGAANRLTAWALQYIPPAPIWPLKQPSPILVPANSTSKCSRSTRPSPIVAALNLPLALVQLLEIRSERDYMFRYVGQSRAKNGRRQKNRFLRPLHWEVKGIRRDCRYFMMQCLVFDDRSSSTISFCRSSHTPPGLGKFKPQNPGTLIAILTLVSKDDSIRSAPYRCDASQSRRSSPYGGGIAPGSLTMSRARNRGQAADQSAACDARGMNPYQHDRAASEGMRWPDLVILPASPRVRS